MLLLYVMPTPLLLKMGVDLWQIFSVGFHYVCKHNRDKGFWFAGAQVLDFYSKVK